MKKSKIPSTDSIQELAEFWDTHDFTDFEDEMEEVTEPVFERSTAIRVELKPPEAQAVQQLAQAKGVSREELVREWVLARLSPRNGRKASARRQTSRRPAKT